ncbi:hypothetical protein D4764_12G0011660 [Takifugu flavidus]|uniref:Uncharacterized protein n=1 Tax=Takifugu flavidus TaxID=433684 RepID=A0A5C6PFC9_9TELE|nr:hypothetical protein D4764_12G0011660 [Takifugu flavidus]
MDTWKLLTIIIIIIIITIIIIIITITSSPSSSSSSSSSPANEGTFAPMLDFPGQNDMFFIDIGQNPDPIGPRPDAGPQLVCFPDQFRTIAASSGPPNMMGRTNEVR